MKKYEIANFLKPYLGDYKDDGKDDVAFNCPFCGNQRYNFAVNINPQSENYLNFHCWACDIGGKNIAYALKKLRIDKKVIESFMAITETDDDFNHKFYTKEKSLTSFIKRKIENSQKNLLLEIKKMGFNEITNDSIDKYKNEINYLLNERKLMKEDLFRFKIMIKKNQILFPNFNVITNFDKNNSFIDLDIENENDIYEFNLNYFIIRNIDKNSKLKYILPKNELVGIKKSQVIFFDWLINWNKPIILTEGVFDAITVFQTFKFQAIPLLGKFLNETLISKLISTNYKRPVIIFLDMDSISYNKKLAYTLIKKGLKEVYYFDDEKFLEKTKDYNVYNNLLKLKDINKMGVQYFNYLIKNGLEKMKN